ncbi:MAG: aminoglycoside phosphotransferase family protein [Leifsonia sp.]
MDAPGADITVDAVLVERLVGEQHPDLAGPVVPVANGWDNAIFRLGDGLAVRMPRRRVAAELVEHEQRWLPALAPVLPVAIPVPVRVGLPTPDYPWHWSIVPWFDGRAAAESTPAERHAAARPLAEFVHALAVPAPSDAPRNPFRGVPLAARDASIHARLASGRLPRSAELGVLWDRLSTVAPWSGRPLWVHGDLHPGNLVVVPGGIAVIDFGDLTAGDPATDLATAWLSFDPAGRAAFRQRMEELREIDAATWQRARAWAMVLGSAIVDAVAGDGPIARVGRHALDQVLLEE